MFAVLNCKNVLTWSDLNNANLRRFVVAVNYEMENYMKNIFGDNLKRLRGKKTQAEMSSELGMIQQTYAKWEIGDRKPDINELAKLALHFGVSVDWFLGLETEDMFKGPLAKEQDQAPIRWFSVCLNLL